MFPIELALVTSRRLNYRPPISPASRSPEREPLRRPSSTRDGGARLPDLFRLAAFAVDPAKALLQAAVRRKTGGHDHGQSMHRGSKFEVLNERLVGCQQELKIRWKLNLPFLSSLVQFF